MNLTDNPILKENDDLLNYRHHAKKVQKLIQNSSDYEDTLIIGVYGKWGQGKTSFLNLINDKIDLLVKKRGKGIMKFHFNPWRYNSEDEILFEFFEGLSSKLIHCQKDSLKKAGKKIKTLSRYMKAVKLSATIGVPKAFNTEVTFEPAEILKVLGEDLEGKEPTIEDLKQSIDLLLSKGNYKIVIFIDDIDRLDKEEIYRLLKIIKLNADFKNVVYIIALDKVQVSKAIQNRFGDNHLDGAKFLEKIVNVPIYLPKIEKSDLKRFFEAKLKIIRSYLDYESNEDKNKEFYEILYRSYNLVSFEGPREIVRVLNSFFITAFSIGDEINLSDLFLIEYLKISQEEVFEELRQHHFKPIAGQNMRIHYDDLFKKGLMKNRQNKIWMSDSKISTIINDLFPEKMGKIGGRSVDIEKLNRELRINYKEHYEKYFSYHMDGKISKNIMSSFESAMNRKDNNQAVIILEKLFDSNGVLFFEDKLQSLLTSDKLLNKEYLFKFLFNNKALFETNDKDMFGNTPNIRIIELIGEYLQGEPMVKDKIVGLADMLNYSELCYFTRNFSNSSFKADLEKLIIKKIQILEKHPFFRQPYAPENKMVMSIWSEHFKKSFYDYVNRYTNSKKNFEALIQYFPAYYINRGFGTIDRSNFDYMKSILNLDDLYKKAERFYPELIEKVKQLNSFEDGGINKIEENIQQFIFLYNKDKNS